MRVEVLNLVSGEWELHIVDADGVEQVEHFSDAAKLAKRQQEIQDELKSSGWSGPSLRWDV